MNLGVETRVVITVYHLATSRSERIVWLMEELGLPYRIERFDRQTNWSAPASLKAVFPAGRAPIIRDGDVVLAESGAILSYVFARHGDGGMLPRAEDADFPAYLFWLHFTEGSLAAHLFREMMLDRMVPDADTAPGMARVRETTRDYLALVETTLGRTPYIAGDRFTGADIMLPFPFTTALRFLRFDLAAYSNLRAYLDRISERPAYRRAMALAGPDATPDQPQA